MKFVGIVAKTYIMPVVIEADDRDAASEELMEILDEDIEISPQFLVEVFVDDILTLDDLKVRDSQEIVPVNVPIDYSKLN